MKGVWDKITIYCLAHDEPVPMKIISNTEYIKTPFYACSNYGGNNGGKPCSDRLNLDDYQGLVYKFFDKMSENPFADLSGMVYTYHGARQKIYVKVLKFTDDEIRLGVRNLTVLPM